MNALECDPRRYKIRGNWTVEPFDLAMARTPPFGHRFFDAIFEEFPLLRPHVSFLRWSELMDDVFAVFQFPQGGFRVEVDTDLEYLIVVGSDGNAEYGDWGEGQVPPAVAHVRRLIEAGGYFAVTS